LQVLELHTAAAEAEEGEEEEEEEKEEEARAAAGAAGVSLQWPRVLSVTQCHARQPQTGSVSMPCSPA
jgi:hypothetical protein